MSTSLKKLSDLAKKFEKLAQNLGGNPTHQTFPEKNPLGDAPIEGANSNEYGDISSSSGKLDQAKKWIDNLSAVVRKLQTETANKPELYSVPGATDEFNNSGGKFDTLFDSCKSIEKCVKGIAPFYHKLTDQERAKLNNLVKRSYMLLSPKRVWNDVVVGCMSQSVQNLLKHVYDGDTGYWNAFFATSKSASNKTKDLKEVHAILNKKASSNYDLTVSEKVKLKNLLKNI
mgnify:FL=1